MRLTGDGDGFQAPVNAEERKQAKSPTPLQRLGQWFTGAREPMNATIVTHDGMKINGRFVPASPDNGAEVERQIGRNLYRRGRPLSECVSDEMAAGYLAEEARCEDMYWRAMQRQASEFRCVNWNSGAEAW